MIVDLDPDDEVGTLHGVSVLFGPATVRDGEREWMVPAGERWTFSRSREGWEVKKKEKVKS